VRNLGAFVGRKRAGWERLDELVRRLDRGALALAEVEELDRLYRRAAGDLAYAGSAFPGTDAVGYLAQLTARAYGALYRRRAGSWGLRRLFAAEIPAVFMARLHLFWLALAFLLAGIAGGAVAVWLDPAAASLWLPRRVLDSVAAGQMWTDELLSGAPGLIASHIARNNISVTVMAFALGLTGGIGTAYLLFANGLILGAAAALCTGRGLAGAFFSFVAAHGPTELLCVLLAGQAGFMIASAIIDPGEWPRPLALQTRAREAVRLVALVIPLLAVVGLVEGYLSPGAIFPGPLKGAFGLLLVAAVLIYLRRGRATANALPETERASRAAW
jgi:uncharacterized membrane protein SpoIIM required for sporulation